MKSVIMLCLAASTLPALAVGNDPESLLFARTDVGRNKVSGTAGNSYSASLGYNINRTFAVEAGYRNLGSLDKVRVIAAGSGQVISNVDVDLTALQVNMLASLPIGRNFAVHGLLGWARSQLEITEAGSAMRARLHHSGLVWGAGARWKFSDGVSAYLQHTVYPGLSKHDDQDDIELGHSQVTSAGLAFGF